MSMDPREPSIEEAHRSALGAGSPPQFEFLPNEIEDFEQELAELQGVKNEVAFRIIRAQLIIEYYLNRCFDACHPFLRYNGKMRLTFAQKVELIPAWCFGIIPGLKEAALLINALRNKVAHDLRYTVTESELAALRKQVEWPNHFMKRDLSGDKVIEAACSMASMGLNAWTLKISRVTRHGIGGYTLFSSQMQGKI